MTHKVDVLQFFREHPSRVFAAFEVHDCLPHVPLRAVYQTISVLRLKEGWLVEAGRTTAPSGTEVATYRLAEERVPAHLLPPSSYATASVAHLQAIERGLRQELADTEHALGACRRYVAQLEARLLMAGLDVPPKPE